MKKVYTLMMIVAAAAMVSCAGRQAKTTEAAETEAPATEVVEEKACCEKAEGECCEKAEGEVAVEEAVVAEPVVAE